MDPPPAILTVSELNERVRDTLQSAFSNVWVAGEMSDVSRPRSGHVYFSLKDDAAQVRAVIWRSTVRRLVVELVDGLQVLCQANVDVYPPRGSYQLIVRQLEPRGVGALQLALRQLREKLAAEGLFDPERKRPLPRYPRQVAVVTSPSGAALHDFLQVSGRRWPGTDVLILPTRVQGSGAAAEIAAAIGQAGRLRPIPDVLLVTRGGGSLEDLWSFNDEEVVRAIHASPIPTVSAVGHEIDVTLADLVADRRALTPSEAGELMVPDGGQLRQTLVSSARRLRNAVARYLQDAQSRLDALASRRVLRQPRAQLRDAERQLDELQNRLSRSCEARLARSRDRLNGIAARLHALSPLGVLGRGYSLTQRADGSLLTSARQVAAGQRIWTRLAEGRLVSRVEGWPEPGEPPHPERPKKGREL
jgi:exodeoxyribonuclease VII large subunit